MGTRLSHFSRSLFPALEREQVGMIRDVQSEPGRMQDDQAEAAAVLETERSGRVTLRFGLSRQAGAWAIDELSALRSEQFSARGAGSGIGRS